MLVRLDRVEATFYVPNRELAAAKRGLTVSAIADAYPGRTFNGTIDARRREGGVHAAQRADARGPRSPGLCGDGRASTTRRRAAAGHAGRSDVGGRRE